MGNRFLRVDESDPKGLRHRNEAKDQELFQQGLGSADVGGSLFRATRPEFVRPRGAMPKCSLDTSRAEEPKGCGQAPRYPS